MMDLNYGYILHDLDQNQNVPIDIPIKNEFTEIRSRQSFSSESSATSGLSNSSSDSNGTTDDSISGMSMSSIAYASGNSTSVRRTRQLEELCVVCEDRSSGYHYNALTCEGCKAFFSRTILRTSKAGSKSIKPCKNQGACVRHMDMYLRRKCPSCRFQKCLQMGMMPGCVLRPTSTSTNEPTKIRTLTKAPNQKKPPVLVPDPVSSTTTTVIPLTFEDICLIRLLEEIQDKYEKPSEEAIRILSEKSQAHLGNDASISAENSYHAITELTKLTIELIVEFAKHLPGFNELQLDNQIILLKTCSAELMMLRAARRYIFDKDCIKFANGLSFSKHNYVTAGIDSSAEPLFKFCRRLHTLGLDKAEYALLSAIILFSGDRPDVKEVQEIENVQQRYVDVLRHYVSQGSSKHGASNSSVRFAKLLAVITEARELGVFNYNDSFELVWQRKPLPDLLIETYDLSIAVCFAKNLF